MKHHEVVEHIQKCNDDGVCHCPILIKNVRSLIEILSLDALITKKPDDFICIGEIYGRHIFVKRSLLK